MNWSEVSHRVGAGEDAHTEFKRGIDGRLVRRALAAFANTDGGLLVLGVDDDGTICGVWDNPETVAERLTAWLQSGLSSPIQARIGRHESPEGWIHWIFVPRQRGFEPLRVDGRVWVRRGRATVEPSASELQELYNVFGYIVTEERAIEAARFDAIEPSAFRAYLEHYGIDLDDDLQPDLTRDVLNRGGLTRIGDALHATVYGVMAFGRDSQAYPQTANFWVECVAYAGRDRADDVLQVAEARGRLDEQVRRALGWMRSTGRGERYDGATRHDRPRVPERALREALVNAVVHRDYSIIGSKILLEVFDDRVVVTSPGALPNHLSTDAVRAGGYPRSRNESMANFMLTMRLMERRGRGWPVMRRAMREHNGTEPRLEEERDSRFVRVTLLTPEAP